MGDGALDAKSVEALLFVDMGEYTLYANAEAHLLVNMGDGALDSKSAEALLYVNMGDDARNAESAEALPFF